MSGDTGLHELEAAAKEWLVWQRRPVTRSLEESRQRKAAERRLVEAIDSLLDDDDL